MDGFFDRIRKDAVTEFGESGGLRPSHSEPVQAEALATPFESEPSDPEILLQSDRQVAKPTFGAPQPVTTEGHSASIAAATPAARPSEPVAAATSASSRQPEPVAPTTFAPGDGSVAAAPGQKDSVRPVERADAPKAEFIGSRTPITGAPSSPGAPLADLIATPPGPQASSGSVESSSIDDYPLAPGRDVAELGQSYGPILADEASMSQSERSTFVESPVASTEGGQERSSEESSLSPSSSPNPAPVPWPTRRSTEPGTAGEWVHVAQRTATETPSESAVLSQEGAHQALRLEVQQLQAELMKLRQQLEQRTVSTPSGASAGVHIRQLEVIVQASQPRSASKSDSTPVAGDLVDRNYLSML